MKKLLSVIVTVAMLISCISPSLVTFAADEPALVIADASFDPAARDAKATATVSIANNPGFCFGGFYLYYDSTKLEVKDGAITSLVGDDYTLEATYNVASGDKNPANALADAGVEASDDLVCVEIIVEGNDDYMLEDLFAVELNVIAELAEGETLTYGVVPGVGRNDAPYNANEDDVAFAAGVGTITAVADPNTPIYEDKQFDSTTVYADSVTVNKGVTTVEVGFAVGGTGELIEAYGMNTLVFRLVYPKELKLLSTRLGDVFAAADNGIDLDSTKSFADPDYVPSKEIKDECAWSGYDWENSDDYIVSALFSDDDPYYQCKNRGYVAYATFEVPADAVGTYDIKLISCEENLFASVYETTDDVPEPTYIPFEIDNGSITVSVANCKHENVTVTEKAPTCTEAGVSQTVCGDCGVVVSEETVPALGHSAGDKIVVTEPTVESEGWYEIKCGVCGEVVESGVIPAIEAVVFTIGEATAKYGDTVSLPINVSNNNGMFIATFDVVYDAAALTFKGFTAGDVFPADANVSATEYEAGKVRIYFECADVADATADGLLGNIEFAVANDSAFAGQTVEVSATAEVDNIIDAEGIALVAVFKSGSVTVASRETKIAVGNATAPFGKEVVVPVTVEGNTGMFIAILDVAFDAAKLDYVGFENGDVFGAANVYAVEYADGKVQLYFEAEDNADVTANGVLGNLKFVVADNADLLGSDIAVTLAADDVNMLNYAGETFEYVLADGAVTVADRDKVCVSDSSAKYGDEAVVDLAIYNNPGFFIGIFDVKYDESVLTFDRVVGGMENIHLLFSGEEGSVRVYVEAVADADITVDGVLASLAFDVAADAALVGTATDVAVEIVEVINYAGEDVELAAVAGSVTVLDRETIAVDDTVAEFKHNVKVPVSVSLNTGFWAAVVEYTFDADAFDFVGVESGLFETVAGESYSCNGNVITVFVENADVNANVTEDGVLYYLVFAPKAEDSAMTVEAEILEIINVDAEDVVGFATASGNITTAPCDHSEGETYSKVTKDPTAFEEGVRTFYCALCDAEVRTEAIAKLEAIVIGNAEVGAGADLKVPVSLSNNKGVWSIGLEIAYDAAAFEFVGVESGLFAVSDANASANDGVITVFVDAADLADITGDGVAFKLVFKTAAEADGEYALSANVIGDNTINANGDNVEFVAVDGKIVVGEHTHTPSADAPTCTDDVVCTGCGITLEKALGHEIVVDEAVEPTCTETGLTEGSHCEVCGEVIVAQEVVPALGHNEVTTPGYEATCTEAGLTDEIYCTVCGEVLQAAEVIPALGHTEVTEGAYDPTCTEPGQTGTVYCSVCGETIKESEEIPALGHDFSGDFVIDKEAEVGVEGEMSKHCLNGCGERSEITVIPAIPSEYKLTIDGEEQMVAVGETFWLYTEKSVFDDNGYCHVFENWVVVSGTVEIDDVNSTFATFVMPEEDVVIETERYIVGDVNDDGAVNALDYLAVKKAVKTDDTTDLVNLDVNGDGKEKPNAYDIIAIKAIIKGTFGYENYLG